MPRLVIGDPPKAALLRKGCANKPTRWLMAGFEYVKGTRVGVTDDDCHRSENIGLSPPTYVRDSMDTTPPQSLSPIPRMLVQPTQEPTSMLLKSQNKGSQMHGDVYRSFHDLLFG